MEIKTATYVIRLKIEISSPAMRFHRDEATFGVALLKSTPIILPNMHIPLCGDVLHKVTRRLKSITVRKSKFHRSSSF